MTDTNTAQPNQCRHGWRLDECADCSPTQDQIMKGVPSAVVQGNAALADELDQLYKRYSGQHIAFDYFCVGLEVRLPRILTALRASTAQPTQGNAALADHLDYARKYLSKDGFNKHVGVNMPRILAALRASPAAEPVTWRCFHCGETFTDVAQARTHFGRYEHSMPLCLVDEAEYRRMEKALTVWQSEDTDLHREIGRLSAQLTVATREAEEAGYAKGLRDGLDSEREEHAQLQARCYDMGGTFWSVFDEVAALKIERALLRDALTALVKELADADEEGLIEHSEQMIAAHAALAASAKRAT